MKKQNTLIALLVATFTGKLFAGGASAQGSCSGFSVHLDSVYGTVGCVGMLAFQSPEHFL